MVAVTVGKFVGVTVAVNRTGVGDGGAAGDAVSKTGRNVSVSKAGRADIYSKVGISAGRDWVDLTEQPAIIAVMIKHKEIVLFFMKQIPCLMAHSNNRKVD